MPDEHRTTQNRRKAREGLVAVRIGARVYWVATNVARRIEAMCVAPGNVTRLRRPKE